MQAPRVCARSGASTPAVAAVVRAPPGHEALAAVAATTPTVVTTTAVVPTVVAATGVVRPLAAACALTRSTRTGRTAAVRRRAGDEPQEVALGDGHT